MRFFVRAIKQYFSYLVTQASFFLFSQLKELFLEPTVQMQLFVHFRQLLTLKEFCELLYEDMQLSAKWRIFRVFLMFSEDIYLLLQM